MVRIFQEMDPHSSGFIDWAHFQAYLADGLGVPVSLHRQL